MYFITNNILVNNEPASDGKFAVFVTDLPKDPN